MLKFTMVPDFVLAPLQPGNKDDLSIVYASKLFVAFKTSSLSSVSSDKKFFAIPVHCEKLSVKRGQVMFKYNDNVFSQFWLSFII